MLTPEKIAKARALRVRTERKRRQKSTIFKGKTGEDGSLPDSKKLVEYQSSSQSSPATLP